MTESLSARVAREKLSYNEGDVYAESAKFQGRFYHVFNCPNTRRLESYFSEVTSKSALGADVLDYGCLNGAMAPFLLGAGAKSVTGIDISDVAIAQAEQRYGSRASFHIADAHNTPFEPESFDLVVGRSILHHLDWEVALNELNRIVRPGGTIIFTEPLGDNPGAKLLRFLTPKARTKDEAPLSRKQLDFADELFGVGEHFFINLASVPVGMLTSRWLASADCLPLRCADAVDLIIARTPLRFWMRSVVLVWRKRDSDR